MRINPYVFSSYFCFIFSLYFRKKKKIKTKTKTVAVAHCLSKSSHPLFISNPIYFYFPLIICIPYNFTFLKLKT